MTSSPCIVFSASTIVGHAPVVAVREHAALRRPGGAGGVDVEAVVVERHAGHALVHGPCGRPVGAAAELVEADGAIEVAGREGHDRVEGGEVVTYGADLGELLLVLDEHRARLRVVEHVVALLRRVGLVDRHAGRAGGQDAEAGVGPLGAAVAEDRDLVAWLDAELDQPGGDGPDLVGQLGIVDVHPFVADLVAQRGAVGELRSGGERQIRHRARAGARLGGGERPHFHQLLLARLGQPAKDSMPRKTLRRSVAALGAPATLVRLLRAACSAST